MLRNKSREIPEAKQVRATDLEQNSVKKKHTKLFDIIIIHIIA